MSSAFYTVTHRTWDGRTPDRNGGEADIESIHHHVVGRRPPHEAAEALHLLRRGRLEHVIPDQHALLQGLAQLAEVCVTEPGRRQLQSAVFAAPSGGGRCGERLRREVMCGMVR